MKDSAGLSHIKVAEVQLLFKRDLYWREYGMSSNSLFITTQSYDKSLSVSNTLRWQLFVRVRSILDFVFKPIISII